MVQFKTGQRGLKSVQHCFNSLIRFSLPAIALTLCISQASFADPVAPTTPIETKQEQTVKTTEQLAKEAELAEIKALQAARLYDEVWKLINARFVDAQKNGQDWLIWRHRYDAQMRNIDDANVAIRTMLISLNDIYTRYLDPEEFAEEGRSIKALLFGIGIQIGVANDRIVVIAPIEDTPAEKAGLVSGDVLLEIDGKSTQGMDTKDAADLIRGAKGTPVKILVQPKGKTSTKLYTIVREEIKLKSVSKEPPIPVDSRLGYIRLSSFLSETAGTEFEKALKEQANKQAYIVDLRSNPGGLLKNAIVIADDFLNNGGIVSTVDKDGYKESIVSNQGTMTDKPVVLLINGGSASASEILSGALKDNNRSALVGETTFGKGLVQEINALPLGAGVNITTQKYLTPNDTDINKRGIAPDVVVTMPELKDDERYDAKKHGDPQLKVAESVALQMVSGKSLETIQKQDLIQASKTTKPAQTASKQVGPGNQLDKIKMPVKIR